MHKLVSAHLSPERRTSGYFFTQFMSIGAAHSFAGIWFASKGFSADQIGVINAAPIIAMLAFNLLVGRIADRASDWRQVIIVGAVASGLLSTGLFLVNGYWGILVFWSLTGIAQALVIPVADAAAIRITRRRGSDYGTIRAWTTVGYLLVTFSAGYLVAWYGIEIFLPLFVGLALLRGLVSFGLPKFRASKDEPSIQKGAVKLREIMRPWFLLPLFGFALLNATHMILNVFLGLLWQQQGIPANIIGILLTVGALSEAAMFFGFKRFATRFSARNLILIAAIVSIGRWIAMSFSPGIEALFFLQLLHSITFALGFLGVMNFVANWTSEDIAAETQSFLAVIQQATAIAAYLVFGGLATTWGAQAYWVSAALALASAILVWSSLRLQQPKR